MNQLLTLVFGLAACASTIMGNMNATRGNFPMTIFWMGLAVVNMVALAAIYIRSQL